MQNRQQQSAWLTLWAHKACIVTSSFSYSALAFVFVPAVCLVTFVGELFLAVPKPLRVVQAFFGPAMLNECVQVASEHHINDELSLFVLATPLLLLHWWLIIPPVIFQMLFVLFDFLLRPFDVLLNAVCLPVVHSVVKPWVPESVIDGQHDGTFDPAIITILVIGEFLLHVIPTRLLIITIIIWWCVGGLLQYGPRTELSCLAPWCCGDTIIMIFIMLIIINIAFGIG